MKIRIAGDISESIVDGPGIRYVIFTQGCPHHCLGCHNPETHDFDGGELVNIDDIIDKLKSYPYMTGITISGGEPFVQKSAVLELISKFKKLYPQKNILIFTGFTFEELLEKNDNEIDKILKTSDYLIDGRFVQELRDISLIFRGSKNQRIIDLQSTFKNKCLTMKEF